MRRIISFVLACTFLVLSACSLEDPSLDVTESPNQQKNQQQPEPEMDTVFGIAYAEEEHMNPLATQNKVNLELYGLVFEGLFEINDKFEPEYLLCDSYTVEGNTYRMHIKQGVTFSDGSALQASDVVASLRLAKEEASYYAPRLANIASVRADGGDTVVVTLNRMNGNLPRLLDVPIIKKGSEEDKVALGTGGYVLQADEQNGGYILTAREGWHLGKNRPYARIELTKVGTVDELIFGFESHDIDLVTVDSTSADPIQFRGEYESREYPTTVMQYLGFNMRRDLFSNALVRQAVTCAIDRENAVEQDYARLADATLLPIHPASPAYDGEIAKNFSFSLENAKGFFTAAGYTDQNGDGKLDNGRRGALGFEILVNSENKSRCAVARRISQDLAKIGVTVTIREAKWEEYMRALEQGEFDAYLGEVNLTADFELDRLVRSGGALNYGRYASSDTDALLDAYHTATLRKSDETANFYQNFVLQAPIAPILFKKNTAITHRGFFETITPTQRNPYYHFFDWKPVKHG